MDKIVGIDLGTTNSAIAHVVDGNPEIIPNLSGNKIMPSVVAMSEDGSHIVGEAASNMEIQQPERTVSSIKRKMGEDVTVEINDTDYTPEEISSHILDKMVSSTERKLSEEVDKAVITVPAYFNDKQRNATIDAGRISDIKVERIINEPTAAAMAYGISGYDDSRVLVYDLGGGTFDVSILNIGAGLYEIESADGINELGGMDWTRRIVEDIEAEIQKEYGVEITDLRSKQRLWKEAEKAKKELSKSNQTEIIIPFLSETEDGSVINVNYTITREDFEDLTKDLIDRTLSTVQDCIEQAEIERSEIDDILLVGGATKMPQVQNLIEENLEKEPLDDVNPEEVVAKGAAVQAAILDNRKHGDNIDNIVLLDVTPISLGVEVEGGIFEPVVEKNTTIPAQETKDFTTAKNNQISVTINVYQGERKIASENTLLESFELKGIPKMLAGQPKIEVRFTVDENGVLSVSAREKSTGKQKKITIDGNVGMSEDEVSEARSDALRNRRSDEIKTEKIRLENLAETQINQAESILKSYTIPNEYEEKLRDRINSIENNMGSNYDPQKLENLIEELELVVEEVTIQHL